MRALPARFIADESGQGLIEYAMIVALVATALIAILVLFRNSVGNVFNSSRNELDAAQLNGY
jgi:pilus assembly protein Flp/PilA